MLKKSSISTLPKTPSSKSTANTQSARKTSAQRTGSPFGYGGDKSKSNGIVTNPPSQAHPKKHVEKTVMKPPKLLAVSEDVPNENYQFTNKLNSKDHNKSNRDYLFDGKDKLNFTSLHTNSQHRSIPRDIELSKDIRGANTHASSNKYSATSNTQFSTQSAPQETNKNYISKQISSTQIPLTKSSETQNSITNRPILHSTPQQKYSDRSLIYPLTNNQSLTNKQTSNSPYAPNWDSNNSPDVITSINQPKISQNATKQPTEGKPIRGLKNLGNTCFMNCILQCLSHTIPLREFYVSDEYKQHTNNRRDLSYIFRGVMLELWSVSSDSVAPYELKRQVGIVAPRFSGYNQHDAQEFMRFLLNELHDEINRASVKGRESPADNETLQQAHARYLTWEDSRISDLFGGMLWSEVCCSVCGHKSTVYDPFLDLALPIPKKKVSYSSPSFHKVSLSYDMSFGSPVPLSECFDMFTTVEKLEKEERPYCAKCKKLTESTKQLGIATLPRYLVIQLKRFSGYQVRTKLSTPVSFVDTWEIKDSAKEKHTYSLYGIVSHSGGIYGGHYVAYCKYKVWRCFNDTMARDVSWEHVKGQEAYILFYEKD